MKSSLAVVLLLAALCQASHLLDRDEGNHWLNFKTLHGKTYSRFEDGLRKEIFEKNLQKIVKHNIEHDLGITSFRMGINQFTDMTEEEIVSKMTGIAEPSNRTGPVFQPTRGIELPDSVDWRTKGYVTPVKNQEGCGSCWAFSAVGSLEGQHMRKTGQLVSLSEQNLVDCSKENGGCGGGWMDLAFDYVIKNEGIDTEESYPYEGVDAECRFKKSGIGATATGHISIEKKDEEALKQAVATVGPISVAIEASGKFMGYKSGVLDDPSCHENLNHGVLLVGYGTENGKDYWLVKNSWGPRWGEAGYIKMARGKQNQCGIASAASYPDM